MKQQTFTTASAVLRVTGNIWQGARCQYEYPLSGQHPKTLAEAKSIAGDFATLAKAHVLITKREVTEKTQITKLT